MKKFITLFLLSLIAVTASAVRKENLKVLYVGGSANIETATNNVDPQTLEKSVKERMTNFDRFLRSRFKKVKTVRADQYDYRMSRDYDVTVFDATPDPWPGSEKGRNRTILPSDFSDAAVTIGAASSNVTKNIGCKNDWYCLCLNNYAHSWRKDHPIFKGPFAVDLNVEHRPVPESTLNQHKMTNTECPASVDMWKVSDRDWTADKGARIGLVSADGGYEDSPEAEFISGGESSKTLGAVAVGRHANFLHWGFAADPAAMTETARNVFANAIVYASKFKGQHMIARKFSEYELSRDLLYNWMDFSMSRENWQHEEEANVKVKKMLDQMGQKPRVSLDPKTYNEFIRNLYPELYDVLGPDPAEYKRYYKVNRPYLHPSDDGKFRLVVDTDCREIGIANNDIALLDTAINLWQNGGKNADLGQRLLQRYTLCRFGTPSEFREWFDENRDRLFFTEAGGYLWLVDSQDPKTVGNDYSVIRNKDKAHAIVSAMAAKEKPAVIKPKNFNMTTSVDEPVACEGAVSTDSSGNRYFTVTMLIHQGFHAYATVDPSESLYQTNVELVFPEGITPVGEMNKPSTYPTGNGTTLYKGTVVFAQQIAGSGHGEVKAKIVYQVCDSNGCRIPTEKVISVEV